MTEPTAEHLKAAQEWLSEHDGFCVRSVEDDERGDGTHSAAQALATLLASREQALREERDGLVRDSLRSSPPYYVHWKKAVERLEAAEARLKQVEETLRQADLWLLTIPAATQKDADRRGKVGHYIRTALAAARSSEEKSSA